MELPVQLLQQSIRRGSVLLSDSFEDIDHAKFFAVVGVYQDHIAGFFFINSRVHPIVESKSEHFAMQYLLRKRIIRFCIMILSSARMNFKCARLLPWLNLCKTVKPPLSGI